MKVAVTSTGKNMSSEVDQRFGRAPCFIIFDTDTGEARSLDNLVNVNAIQGAGIQAGENIVREGVDVVITGHCGPNAFRTLNAAGIKVVIGASGTIENALEKYEEGDLKENSGPDVRGHWI
jgi:predicted Fe-Mo cluster-binding NifX family protein